MLFNKHYNLRGTHAFLSPSSPAWMNYDEDKVGKAFIASEAARRGTELHAFAAEAIRLREKLADNGKTLNSYVNDAIGFMMTPEQVLYYSDNAYGSADAIGFRNNTLRIHDLKTGVNPGDIRQLVGYAALFCMEYMVKPFDIEIELRIYQNDEVKVYNPDPNEIIHVMDRIKVLDKVINQIRMEVQL